MEHKELNPGGVAYPSLLRERLGAEAPTLTFRGALRLLSRFCIGVACTDDIPGSALMAANDLLFVVRETPCNYVGGWHSVMETEMFRLALDRRSAGWEGRSLTAIRALGFRHQTPVDFLTTRFGNGGPFSNFPEKAEFLRRDATGEMLWLSAAPDQLTEMTEEVIARRNQVACALAHVVFLPYAGPASRTLTLAAWIRERGIPAFTSMDPECEPLRDLGISGLTRKQVRPFLDNLGASAPGWPSVDACFAPPERSGEGALATSPSCPEGSGQVGPVGL